MALYSIRVSMLRKKKSFFFVVGLLSTIQCHAAEPPLLVQPEPKNQTESSSNVDVEQMKGEVEVLSSEVIQSIHFSGGTSLELEQLAQDVQVLLNQPYSVELIGQAIEKITQRFHIAGYPLAFATVKQNDFRDGRLTITIVEGFVIRSELEIPNDTVKHKVRSILQPLLNENPATQASLERAILLINRIPGYQFDITLPRPKTISGATSIRIVTRDKTVFEPFIGYSMQQDSERNFSLGLRSNINRMSINRLTLIGLLPRDNNSDEGYYSMRLEHDIFHNGTLGRLSASYYTDNEESILDIGGVKLAVNNTFERHSLDYVISYPITLNQTTDFSVSLGVLYEKEERNYDVSFNGTSLGNLDDHLDYVIGQISIDVIKRFNSFNFSAGLGVNQSISSAFRYRSDLETENIYNSDFTFYDLNLSTSYEFIKDYVVSLRANGMFADERIVPSQRLNYGGLNYGRGYPENTIEGDRGYGTEVKLLQRNKHGNYFFNPYITYDFAYTERELSTARTDRISSAALGVEIGFEANLYVAIDYAKPLKEREYNNDYVYNLNINWQF
ncbi:ShlB/FhaC/HecB family hemolysin secretion/activation protein [Vibrio kanaloae]|nr:ShlB/FhaC/HecB family hemolysin secretion/activation protein [Vibrio kanaloae]